MIGLLMLAAAVMGRPSQTTSGGFVTGNQLLDRCNARQGECLNFIEGATDGALFYKSWGAPKANFCIPAGVTIGQIRDIAVQFLTAHPETRHMGAAGLIVTSLYIAFPCADPG